MASSSKIKEISSDDEVSDGESILSDEEYEEDGISQLVNHFFTNDEGENIANILTDIKKSLDTHNKLIYKMLSLNSKNKKEDNNNEKSSEQH